jgi:hypothetical protein
MISVVSSTVVVASLPVTMTIRCSSSMSPGPPPSSPTSFVGFVSLGFGSCMTYQQHCACHASRGARAESSSLSRCRTRPTCHTTPASRDATCATCSHAMLTCSRGCFGPAEYFATRFRLWDRVFPSPATRFVSSTRLFRRCARRVAPSASHAKKQRSNEAKHRATRPATELSIRCECPSVARVAASQRSQCFPRLRVGFVTGTRGIPHAQPCPAGLDPDFVVTFHSPSAAYDAVGDQSAPRQRRGGVQTAGSA